SGDPGWVLAFAAMTTAFAVRASDDSIISPRVLSSGRKQRLEVLVELTDRISIGAEQREVPVDGLDRPELGIGNEPPLGLTISRREEHVRRHRHDEGLGFDAAQCRSQVAAGVA